MCCCEKENQYNLIASKTNMFEMKASDLKAKLSQAQQLLQAAGVNFTVPDLASLGVFNEQSECCCRFFCRSMRSFRGTTSISKSFTEQVVVKTEAEYGLRCVIYYQSLIFNNPFISWPCAKPEIKISILQGSNPNPGYIGSVQMPYYLPICNRNPNCCPIMELDIRDAKGNLLYMISGNCCQKSVWCVGPCQEFGCKIINY